MLSDFYGAFGPVALTVFGLWLVVVQTRYDDWSRSVAQRRRAYAVSLHFAIPGLMSLLALVDANDQTLWRIAFGVAAFFGATILGYLELSPLPTPRTVPWRLQAWLSILMYVAVFVIAVAPDSVKSVAAPLRIEAILLALIVFLGLNVAWALMFEGAAEKEKATPPAETQPPPAQPQWYR
jgi:phosphatidylserine synthase